MPFDIKHEKFPPYTQTRTHTDPSPAVALPTGAREQDDSARRNPPGKSKGKAKKAENSQSIDNDLEVDHLCYFLALLLLLAPGHFCFLVMHCSSITRSCATENGCFLALKLDMLIRLGDVLGFSKCTFPLPADNVCRKRTGRLVCMSAIWQFTMKLSENVEPS